MKLKKIVAALGAVVLAGTLAACGSGSGGGNGGGDTLKIGIKFDQPGVGFKNADGTFSGFDVDMARYIAKGLGYDEDKIQFVEAVSANRETFLRDGTVDMILASYSITPERKQEVDFAGPYFVAGQDLLVRADDKSITGPDDLNGKKLCSVTGSTPAQNVKENYAKQAQLQEFDTYSKCITALEAGQIDAVTTDNVILAGYAQQNPGKFRIVGKPFSTEKYGVGLPKGSKDRNKINDLIEKSFSDGTWKKAFEDNLGKSGFKLPAQPKVDRY